MAAVTGTRRHMSVPAERVFYLSMAIALFLTVFVGFARSYYLNFWFSGFPRPRESIFYVKGAFFTVWCVLLIVQASLITAGRRPLHRALGVVGVAIAIAMVIIGAYASTVATVRAPGGPVDPMPLDFLLIPYTDLALFAGFVATAVVRRNSPQTHKRLMLIATTVLVVAGVARLPGLFDAPFQVSVAVADLFLIPILGWDIASSGRVHPATLGGGLTLIGVQLIRYPLQFTAGWLAIAGWASSLVR